MVSRLPMRHYGVSKTGIFQGNKNYAEPDYNAEVKDKHCVKGVRIRSYSAPHFPVFGLNTERYGVPLRIQSKCRKIRTRIAPNTVPFFAVKWPGFKNIVFRKL